MKRSLRILGVLVLGAVVLFGATGCLDKSPEKVIEKMMKKMADFDSANVDLRVGLNGQFPQLSELDGTAALESSTVFVNFKGDIDLESEENVQYHLIGDISNKMNDSEMQVAGELLSKGGDLYIKLSETPSVQMFDLSALKGLWYKFDLNSFKVQTEQTDAEQELSRSQIKKMQKLLANTEFFRVVKDNGEEALDGIATYHYEVKVNQSELEKFFREANKIVEGRELTQIEEQEMNDNLQKLSEIDGDLWIGKKDYMLYRVELSGQSETEENGVTRYDIAINLRNFGKKVEINKPSDVREFDMMSLFAPQFGDMEGFDNWATELDSVDNEDILKQFEGMEGVDMNDLEKQLEELQKQFNDQGLYNQ